MRDDAVLAGLLTILFESIADSIDINIVDIRYSQPWVLDSVALIINPHEFFEQFLISSVTLFLKRFSGPKVHYLLQGRNALARSRSDAEMKPHHSLVLHNNLATITDVAIWPACKEEQCSRCTWRWQQNGWYVTVDIPLRAPSAWWRPFELAHWCPHFLWQLFSR
jgi:hypothetical protein